MSSSSMIGKKKEVASAVVRWVPSSSNSSIIVVRWSPEQQIWRKFIEAVDEVMSPDKLIAGSVSRLNGWRRRSSRDGLCTGVRAVIRSRLTIETMSLCALYICDILNDPVSRDQILRRKRGEENIIIPCLVEHEQEWQPYPVDPYSAICTYLRLSSCGVMGGRKRRGRPGILPAIFCFSSPSHKGAPTIFLHVFFGLIISISIVVFCFLFCRLPQRMASGTESQK